MLTFNAAALVALLSERNLTLSTAESCTGGLIASAIVDVPGASAVFWGGAIAYTEAIKSSLLGVPEDVIRERGVVSRDVAALMAEGARRRFGTDLAVSTTGVAGPGGGTPEAPVGRVYIGVALESKTVVFREDFPGDREAVRRGATERAIRYLCACLTDISND